MSEEPSGAPLAGNARPGYYAIGPTSGAMQQLQLGNPQIPMDRQQWARLSRATQLAVLEEVGILKQEFIDATPPYQGVEP